MLLSTQHIVTSENTVCPPVYVKNVNIFKLIGLGKIPPYYCRYSLKHVSGIILILTPSPGKAILVFSICDERKISCCHGAPNYEYAS